ncbi:MAG: zinc-binding dehydrogenase [Deltaproteobacteria bacterium]|nr:zinc-binding dehydrogenase [Deltaproteobacteria bacterium]
MLFRSGKARGVDFRFETPAVRLLREDKGKVTGVIARNAQGNHIRFNADRAVSLCTGDYGGDRQMVETYCDWRAGHLYESSMAYRDATMAATGAVIYSAGVKKGQSVAVFGVGGVGLSALAAAKVVGADPIIAVDLDDDKLEFARRFGATITINATNEDPVKVILKATRHPEHLDFFKRPVAGVDFAFDCIGRKTTMEQILKAARSGSLGAFSGGTAVLVGVPMSGIELNTLDLLINEKRYIASNGGSCHPDRDFPIFLEWYKTGQLNLNALVTQRFTLDQINEAVMLLEAGGIKGRAILEFP